MNVKEWLESKDVSTKNEGTYYKLLAKYFGISELSAMFDEYDSGLVLLTIKNLVNIPSDDFAIHIEHEGDFDVSLIKWHSRRYNEFNEQLSVESYSLHEALVLMLIAVMYGVEGNFVGNLNE